jgi:hypothetical protein
MSFPSAQNLHEGPGLLLDLLCLFLNNDYRIKTFYTDNTPINNGKGNILFLISNQIIFIRPGGQVNI